MADKRSDIRDFLLVIGAGVFCAFLLVFWLVKEDPGAKELKVSEALLSPETIEELSNRAVNASGKFSAEYLVESIDFSTFDTDKGKWEMTQVDIQPYQQIYRILEKDVGRQKVPDDVIDQFDKTNISTLAIYVKVNKPYQVGSTNNLFQQIQLLPTDDWYRVQIHADEPQWFYYQHMGALKEILSIVKGQHEG